MFSESGEKRSSYKAAWWRLVYALPVITALLITVLLNAVGPLEIGAIGILVVFLCFYLFFLSVAFVLIRIASQFLGVFGRKKLRPKKAYYLATVVALFPVFLLALNSIGQLQLMDVVLVTLLVGLGCFYIVRQVSS